MSFVFFKRLGGFFSSFAHFYSFLLIFASDMAVSVNMASRLSLGGFLAKARAALTAPAAQRKGPLTFVVGNESAGESSASYN